MEDILKRQENENEFEHHKRLVFGKLVDKTLTDEDYVELSKEVYGQQLSSDVCRREMYGSKYTLKLIDSILEEKLINKSSSNVENTVEEDEFIEKLEKAKQDLQKERIKLSTTKLEYSKWQRQDARMEMFLESMDNAIVKLEPLEIPDHITTIEYEKIGLVNIADAHLGKQGIIRGLRGEIINEYNKEIFKQRMWEVFNDTLKIINKEELTQVTVLSLGDMIEGILRNSQLQSLELGVIDSVIEYSDFIANWINELSKYVKVDYHSAYGNHDGLRLLQAKSAHDFPHENVGRLIDHFLAKRLESNTNVFIDDNQLPFAYFDIFGMNILAMHGEDRDLVDAVKDFKVMYDERIDMLITGHLHKGATQTAGLSPFGDIEVIRIPSICGIDDFSVTIKKFSRAGAKIFIIEKGKGKTITYDVKLF